METKKINDVFAGIKPPGELCGARITSLKVNIPKRAMRLVLRLDKAVKQSALEKLRLLLMDYYRIEDLQLRITYDTEFTAEFLDIYKECLIGTLCGEYPPMKFLFGDSKWALSGDKIEITLVHDCLDHVLENNIAAKIERIIKNETGYIANISFLCRPPKPADMPASPAGRNAAPSIEKKAEATAEKAAAPKKIKAYKRLIKSKPIPISAISDGGDSVTVQGRVFDIDFRGLNRGKTLITFNISDEQSAIACKLFVNEESLAAAKDFVSNGAYLKLRGKAGTDEYTNEITISVQDMNTAEEPIEDDGAPQSRVELHLHTQMSALDGVTKAADFIERALSWGHKAIAITDHGVVQAFPDAFRAKGQNDIKIIYGTECYLVNDLEPIAFNIPEASLDSEMVVFDIETTGLSAKHDAITEIGAVKIAGGKIKKRFQTLVNPHRPISAQITHITGITDKMVQNAPDIKEVLPEFLSFCAGAPLIAHNASFDISFIRRAAKACGLEFSNGYIDTLSLSRILFPNLKRHRLDVVAKHLGINNKNHHRAVNDAEVTANIYFAAIPLLKERGVGGADKINDILKGVNRRFERPHHAVLLAKNAVGLKNLYSLISKSHIDYFSKTPRVPKSVLAKNREGLIIGSACKEGELFGALAAGEDEGKLIEIANFYDYLEIQPLANNYELIERGLAKDNDELKELNRQILALGDRLQKPVAATGDVHFLNPHDGVYREVLNSAKAPPDIESPAPLYFRSTKDMLDEFSYLGEDDAYRVVISNTNLIADWIEDLRPVPKGAFPPSIEGSDGEIKRLSTERAVNIYGSPLPDIVAKRMEGELKSIIDNGFAVMYLIAHLLVKQSLEDGYIVGSRGSVGSSFIAFLTGITEVNALPAHYVCPKCRYSEFPVDSAFDSGCDLPDKPCPSCGAPLGKDGHNIPFETFLGFDGDKAPDIDLNFSGDYQARAHKFAEEIFGEGYTFRAGTISKIAGKTAYGFVKKYCEKNGLVLTKAQEARLMEGCAGVKRTTGQHPGGIIVLPKGHDIHEFTPVQRPADVLDSDVITTHFDYHSIDKNLLKLDLLGHDDPTVIKMLEDYTGVDAAKIPLDDSDTMSLFTSCAALGVSEKDIGSATGTFGIPEFGTRFVRQMLQDTLPGAFSDLVRISGLSHGENVWINNAQALIRAGTCTLSECICTRDDIMTHLIQKGLPAKMAFLITESVRKGGGLTPEWESAMKANNVPAWYISSCKKIKYMFPKAHAVAYVTMSFRIAYFKLYHPLAFYRAYFTVRVSEFDYTIMARGASGVKDEIKRLEALGNRLTQKEKDTLTILEVCLEMYARGFSFLPVDLYKSDERCFLEEEGKILPPLQSLQGLGNTAAKSIVAARKKGSFFSIEDLRQRTRVSKTVIEMLLKSGCLDDLPESSQISLF